MRTKKLTREEAHVQARARETAAAKIERINTYARSFSDMSIRVLYPDAEGDE